MAFNIAVSSSFTAGVLLDKLPRFLDAKGTIMPGLMFMVKGKGGRTNAPTLEIRKMKRGEKSAGRDDFWGSTRRNM
jgi:hypothetical protein